MAGPSALVEGAAAGGATLLALLVVGAVAGPGDCASDAVCRVDPGQPTGCAPAPPCDGPGPSFLTALVVALVTGFVVAVVALLRERRTRG